MPEGPTSAVIVNGTGERSAADAQAPKPPSPQQSPPPAYASLPPLADPYAPIPAPSNPIPIIDSRPGSAASTSSSQTIIAPLQLPPSFPSANGLYTPLPLPSQPPTSTHPHAFGPTPLALALPNGGLPYAYYEPPGAAESRAKRRFLSALVLGFGIYFLVLSALGLEIYGEMS